MRYTIVDNYNPDEIFPSYQTKSEAEVMMLRTQKAVFKDWGHWPSLSVCRVDQRYLPPYDFDQNTYV